MKNILVPTDFSQNALHALRFAMELNRKLRAKLILFHSYIIPVYATDVPVFPQADDELRKSSEEALEKLRTKMKVEYPEMEMETMLSMGYAEDEIAEAALSTDAGLVIMGTQGAEGFREALVGTITASVMESAQCPVIAVPEEAAFKGIHRIIFATSYAEGDFQNVETIIDFARVFDAEVVLLHISSGDLEAAYEFESIERFKERVAEDSNYEKITFKLLENKKIYEGLNEYLNSAQADLVAMTMHKRSFVQKLFNRSMTKKMAYHTHLPLIAFKTNEKV